MCPGRTPPWVEVQTEVRVLIPLIRGSWNERDSRDQRPVRKDDLIKVLMDHHPTMHVTSDLAAGRFLADRPVQATVGTDFDGPDPHRAPT